MPYTQEEIDKKLKILFKNIQEKDQKALQIRDYLQILAGCDRGRDLIMQMPEYTYFTMENATSMMTKGRGGFYSPETDTIIIPDIITNEEKDKKFWAISLGHEMRHAIQFNGGLFEFETPYVSKRYTVTKMRELETKLQDTLMAIDLLDEKDWPASSSFYWAEYKYHLKHGIDEKNAMQQAKDSVARAYWTGLTDMPKKHSEISMRLRRDVCSWNDTYDMQALKNNLTMGFLFRYFLFKAFNQKYVDVFLSQDRIERIQQMKRKEAIAEEQGEFVKAETKAPDEILKIFVSNMGLSLPFDYFSKFQRDRTTVGDCFVLNFDAKGRKKSDVFLLASGFLLKTYYHKKNGTTIRQKEFSLTGRTTGTQIIQKPLKKSKQKNVFLTLLESRQRA